MSQTVAWHSALSTVSQSGPTIGSFLHANLEASADVKVHAVEIRSLVDQLDLDFRCAAERDLRLRRHAHRPHQRSCRRQKRR